MLRRRGIERLTGDLGSWGDSPVLAHGFEDLTGAEWRLLEALSARTDVHVSLPYEPGRAVYASLARTAGISRRSPETTSSSSRRAPPSTCRRLWRTSSAQLFAPTSERAPLDGAIRFLEGAGTRGTLELVAEEALAAIRSGIAPEEIAVVCPSLDAIRVPLETAFAALGVPLAFEGRTALRATPFGHSLVSLLRFAWLGGERPELYAHLRSPYSGLQRREVDWVEGKLRGRGVVRGDRTVEVTAELRGGRPLLLLDRALADDSPVETVRAVGASMLRNAHGVVAPPLGARSRSDLAAHDAVSRTLDELDALARAGWDIGRRDVLAALDRASVPGERAGAPGRVAVIDLLRARTRRFDTVFVLGLEQGTLPRRARVEPFLDEDSRRSLEDRRGARLERPDPASRDRYLFATACTRPRRRLVLVRQAVGDEGTPREPSPFWEAVRELFDEDDVRHQTLRRPLSALTREIEAAPTDRERLRALARAAATEPTEAAALAAQNGWDRRLRRATRAFDRPTRLTHERALQLVGSRDAYSVSDLERMASCSSAWFVERYLRPGTIDREVDRMLRGSILHSALQRFYQQLPSAIPGADRVTPENLEQAISLMRDCVAQAVETGLRIDAGDLDRRELEQGLQRDLEQLVRDEAASKSPFVPRELEVSFRTFELEPGVDGQRQDRPDRPRSDGSARDRRGLQVGRGLVGGGYPGEGPPPAAALHARPPRPARSRARRRRLHAGRRRSPPARDAPRRSRGDPRLQLARLPRARRVRRGDRHGALDGRRTGRADPGGRRPPRPEGRRMPALVRPLAHVPQGATVRPAPNEQQRAATEARGTVFVAAGAGTGKTAVLVERFVRAVVDDGLDVDSVLVITYTERAAGELRARIRASLIERGRPDLALELDGAWVSTIHGFCRRLLGAHPLAAGIDPGFRVLDESQALVLQAEAFTAALEAFCAADEPDRWQLLATYGADGLRRMLVEVYATLRSAGRELVLEPGPRAGLGERVDGVREAADCLVADTQRDRAAA